MEWHPPFKTYFVEVTWRAKPHSPHKVQRIRHLTHSQAQVHYRRYQRDMEVLDIKAVKIGEE
jgi:hypothetical protein